MDKTKIINLTSHTINELITGKSFPTSNMEARVGTKQQVSCKRLGIPVYATLFGEITGLPDPMDDTFYIVSAMVLNASNRTDIMAPGNVRRDEKDKVIGCRGFRLNQSKN